MTIDRRSAIAWLGLVPTVALLETGCASLTNPAMDADAVVDAGFKGVAGSSVNGMPTWSSVQAALDAAPTDSSTPWAIYIRNGVYREKLVISKANIQLYGESRDRTVISFNASNGGTSPSGEKWGTSGSATMTVEMPDFMASNLTVENAFDYPANEAKQPTDPSYNRGPQAVALKIGGKADRSVLRNVRLQGYQDTLFTDAGRSYFVDCQISGHIDFIFGAGQSFFENCKIIARPRKRKSTEPMGYITAPSTQLSQQYGLVFYRCTLSKENSRVAANTFMLGRPWHPTRTFADGRYADPNAVGSSVFIECQMDDHIAGNGWDGMAGTAKDGSYTAIFKPEDARFGEYKSKGPGAAINAQRRQLSDEQAASYNKAQVLDGWIA